MKKTLLSLVALAFALNSFGGVNALSISDLFSNGSPVIGDAYAQILNDYESSRGYLNSTSLTCDAAGEITIKSPIVEDSIFDPSPEYRLFISPYRVEQLKNGDPAVNISNVIMKEVRADSSSEIKFTLSAADINPDTSYYGFIVPIDMYDTIGTPSKEVCFQLNSNMCMLGDECDTFQAIVSPLVTPEDSVDPDSATHGTSDEISSDLDSIGGDDTHGVSCAGMDLAHVTHSVNGDKLTLKWTAVDGDSVEIAIWDPDEKMYKRLANVDMKDEKYVYTMQRNGEQNFRLVSPCGDYNYKADAAIGEPTKEPEIVTPATGPAENVLYIAIAAIVLYGAYAIFFRKSDN